MSEGDRTPSSSSYEKLSDQFDGKMLDFGMKFLAFLAVLILRPLANASAPLFRKNLGIRYFTMLQLFFGLAVWGVVVKNTNSFTSPAIQYCYTKGWLRTGDFLERHKVPAKVVDAVGLAYALLAGRNIRIAFQREKKGQYWHSMSRGESWFNNDSFWLEWGMSTVVCAILFGMSMPAGALFFLSRGIGLYLHQKDQRNALTQYYDRVDAQIEAKFLNLEIATPKPIGETMGFRLMLPPHIKGEQRANVARVLGGQHPPLGEEALPSVRSRGQGGDLPYDKPAKELARVEAFISPVLSTLIKAGSAAFVLAKKHRRLIAVLAGIVVTVWALVAYLHRKPQEPQDQVVTPQQAQKTQSPPAAEPEVAVPAPAQTLAASVPAAPTSQVSPIVAANTSPAVVPTPDINLLNLSNYSRILLSVRSNTIATIATNKEVWSTKMESSRKEIDALGYFTRRKLKPQLESCVVSLKFLLDQHREFIGYVDAQMQMNTNRSEFSETDYRTQLSTLKGMSDVLSNNREAFDFNLQRLRQATAQKDGSYNPFR